MRRTNPITNITLAYWSFMAFISASFIKDNYKNWKKYLPVIISIPGSFCFYFLMSYGAPRALFGSQVYINSIFVSLVFIFISKNNFNFKKLILFPFLLLLIFTTNSLYIFNIKSKNFVVINNAIEKISNDLKKCENKCVNDIAYQPLIIEKDWVMHPDYWKNFVRYIAAKNIANKEK